jgi:hypothetical protein
MGFSQKNPIGQIKINYGRENKNQEIASPGFVIKEKTKKQQVYITNRNIFIDERVYKKENSEDKKKKVLRKNERCIFFVS